MNKIEQEMWEPVIGAPHLIAVPVHETVKRVVVCAAAKDNGVVIASARHFDKQMVIAAKRTREFNPRKAIQGFIDQYGHFMCRKEAMHIVIINKQPLRNPDAQTLLFSEDLY